GNGGLRPGARPSLAATIHSATRAGAFSPYTTNAVSASCGQKPMVLRRDAVTKSSLRKTPNGVGYSTSTNAPPRYGRTFVMVATGGMTILSTWAGAGRIAAVTPPATRATTTATPTTAQALETTISPRKPSTATEAIYTPAGVRAHEGMRRGDSASSGGSADKPVSNAVIRGPTRPGFENAPIGYLM